MWPGRTCVMPLMVPLTGGATINITRINKQTSKQCMSSPQQERAIRRWKTSSLCLLSDSRSAVQTLYLPYYLFIPTERKSTTIEENVSNI